nr:hypothetical protein [Morchella crassipes]
MEEKTGGGRMPFKLLGRGGWKGGGMGGGRGGTLTESWEPLGTYNSGVRVQTDSFTVKEVVFIMNILMIKFNLECSLHTQRGYPVLYIKSKSIKKIYIIF